MDMKIVNMPTLRTSSRTILKQGHVIRLHPEGECTFGAMSQQCYVRIRIMSITSKSVCIVTVNVV